MSNLLEGNAVSDRKRTVLPLDMHGNKLSHEGTELLNAFSNDESVPKSQFFEAFKPVVEDPKNYPLAPAVKLMLDEFRILDENEDGAVDGKEIFRYLEKNEERLWNAPKIKQEDEPWYRVSLEDAKTVLSTAGKILDNLSHLLSPSTYPVSQNLGNEKLADYLRMSVPRGEANPEGLCGAEITFMMLTKEPKDGRK